MDKVPTWDQLRKALRLVSYDHWAGRRITRESARLNGLQHFFSGVECNNGHIAERLVSNGMCVDCTKIKMRHDSAMKREKRKNETLSS